MSNCKSIHLQMDCDRLWYEIIWCMARKNEIIKVNEVHLQSAEEIENLIIEVRGKQTMLDRDIAQLYGVDTKRLNEQVRRNIERFPERFSFQLTDNETTKLVANCDWLQALKHSS